jgi:hypothetical protein
MAFGVLHDGAFSVAGFFAMAFLVFLAFADLLDLDFLATFVALAGLSADPPAGKQAFINV